MNARALMMTLALLLGLLALTGCSTDNNERQRLVAEADITNDGGPLVVARLSDNGTSDDPFDDYTPIEQLEILFSARPANGTVEIEEFGAYSTFNITSYDLTWIPGPDAPAALTDYNVTRGLFTLAIPVYDEANGAILIGNLSMKSEAWFPGAPFTASLLVTFYGHESGSEHEVAIPVGTVVQFVDTISEN